MFYKDKKIGQDGVLERTLYIPEYDTAGYLCQYKADLAVIPVQDYLCLGNEARLNAPATLGLNWRWRMRKGQLSDITIYTMGELNRIYGRLKKEEPVSETEEQSAEEKLSEEEAQDTKC